MSPLRRRLVTLWLLLLAAGAVVILLAPHGPVRHWNARSGLPANHRLAAGDLVPPSVTGRLNLPAGTELLGRYTTGAVGAGEALAPRALAALPDLAAAAPGLVAVLPAARALVEDDGLNAGSEVALCHGRKALPERGRVAAVLCGAAGPCAALVPLSPANLDRLAGAGAAPLDFNPGPGLRCRVDLPAPGALREPSPAPPGARP